MDLRIDFVLSETLYNAARRFFLPLYALSGTTSRDSFFYNFEYRIKEFLESTPKYKG